MPQIRLIPVESGFMTSKAGALSEDATSEMRFPIACWIIEHPKGLVIFDTGLHAELQTSAARLGSLSKVFYQIDMEHDLKGAIESQGIDPAKITHIVFSHLHFDHCGGTAAVPNGRIVVQKAEWESRTTERFRNNASYRACDFDLGHDVEEVEGLHDLFGDSTVICIPTPGHTIGHQSLKVELESGTVVLTGDCCYWRRMLEEDLVPPFGYDLDLQRKSMETLRQFARKGATLIFSHDAEQWAGIDGKPLT